jgi:tetratricopeptide (TPR) repeat protein
LFRKITTPLLPLFGLALLFRVPAHGENDSIARHDAAALISSQKYNAALERLAPLLQAHPKDASLWTLRGLALQGLRQRNESLASFDRALAMDQGYLPALEAASQTAYLDHDPRANGYVQRLLSVDPANEVANAMAGALAYPSHDCASVVDHFQRSHSAVYKDENALAEFADCFLSNGKAGQAVEILNRGSQLHPASVQLKYNLAVAYLQDHDPAQAVRTLEPLAEVRDSGLLNLLAYAYTQVNRPDDAFRTLENAIELSPLEQLNYLDLGILCLELNQENRSVVAATAGIARIDKAPALYLLRGIAYAQLAEYDKAESDFTEAAQLEPDQPQGTIAMSLLYSDRHELQKEEALLDKQLELTPNDAVANYLLADLLIREGAEPGQPEFEKAQSDLAKSLMANPNSAEAQVLSGRLCERANEPAEALDHFRSALKIEPDNRAALDHELLLLRKLHRNREASEASDHLKSVLTNELAAERANSVRVNPP